MTDTIALTGVCSVEGCLGTYSARGLCRKHYRRWQRHGDPKRVDPRGAAARPLWDRFWEKVDTSRDCWEWTAHCTVEGYGQIGLGSRDAGNEYAHRVAWELLVGPIPEGLHLDHLCRNRRCVNPEHLDPVTPAENQRRGVEVRLAKKGYAR